MDEQTKILGEILVELKKINDRLEPIETEALKKQGIVRFTISTSPTIVTPAGTSFDSECQPNQKEPRDE